MRTIQILMRIRAALPPVRYPVLLTQANVADLSKQVELALFFDAKLDLAAPRRQATRQSPLWQTRSRRPSNIWLKTSEAY